MNERLKEELKEQLENHKFYCSDYCYDVVNNLINDYDYENEDEFRDYIFEEAGERFIYYKSAFNYIVDRWITDFEEAINIGLTDVCQIASYYLEEEVSEFISDYLDFDIEEDEEED